MTATRILRVWSGSDERDEEIAISDADATPEKAAELTCEFLADWAEWLSGAEEEAAREALRLDAAENERRIAQAIENGARDGRSFVEVKLCKPQRMVATVRELRS